MITQNQKEKAAKFLQCHHAEEPLVLLNSWDPGSSKLIEANGFKAIGTTSMGIAATLGYPDGQVIPMQEMADAIAKIVNNVSIPVNADIEGGYGNTLDEIVASTRKIIETGIVGINIEDSVKLSPNLVDTGELCERVSALRALSDSLGFHLVINVRTDVFLAGAGEPENRLKEAIMRGNKYREAGADCIFVPNVSESSKIASLVKEIDAPINILVNPTAGAAFPPPISELRELGVARVSFGSAPLKAVLALTNKIARELMEKGTYHLLSETLTPMENTLQAYKMAIE